MLKKFTNSNKFFVSVFFGISFFLLPITKIFADLEVKYPTITALGQSSGSVSDLPSYVKYLFVAGMSVGLGAVFISLAIAGVMFILSPINAGARAAAKDRATGAISGLLILVLLYLIVTTINPQLNAFTITKITPSTLPSVTVTNPGIYIYKSSCSGAGVNPSTSSIADLGPLKKSVHAVKVVQDINDGVYFTSILYGNPNFWGECKEIDPDDDGCQTVDPFASSVSIHQYDFDDTSTSNGGGVYFYRKSCFNDGSYNDINSLIAHCNAQSGGYYEINPEGTYKHDLNTLTFTNVPEDEQNCIEYDKNGDCCTKADASLNCDKDGRTPQTLGGENISSMIINGDYIVLLVYKAANDGDSGPWTSCQEFPTNEDTNKIGPRQIKWQNIRNTEGFTTDNAIDLGGVIPNYLVIMPIKS